MIAIIDYDMGNLRSLENALDRLGATYCVTADPDTIRKADKVILPGVGHAGLAMDNLVERGLPDLIRSLRQPVLGICIGQQLLCRHSEEGDVDCIGVFDADVRRFSPTRHEDKVPCMGWNKIEVRSERLEVRDMPCPLFEGLGDEPYVYFVHSYYVPLCQHTAAVADYILPYSASMHKENFYACQFHPEKSGKVGERILENFLKVKVIG